MDAPPDGTTLDRRGLNRTYLTRQLLLERVALPIDAAIEHLVGLQAQVPTDPYTALWSRLRAFDPAQLGAMIADREAVRMSLLRMTLHLVTARDARRMRPVLQPMMARAFRSSAFGKQLGEVDLDAVLAAGTALLEDRPRTTSELGVDLAATWPDADRPSLAYAVRYLVPLVQIPPRGVWGRSGAARFTTLASWLGAPLPEEALTAEDAPAADAPADALLLRYLRAFGPATISDVRTWSWFSGLRPVVARLRPQLRWYRDDAGRELLDVPGGVFADPATPAPVRFLPEFDNALLSHADRSRITGDGTWGTAYFHRGAFTVDGFLAGAWRVTRSRGAAQMEVEPFRSLAPRDRDEVGAEAEALLAFLAADAGTRSVTLRD